MRYKVRAKDCSLFVRAKASWGEKFDEAALNAFIRLNLRGFLQPRLVRKGVVEFSGPIGITLQERLKKPISKRDFYHIMEQTVVTVQKVRNNCLSMNLLVMDLNRVYINEVTKEMQFIYLPMVEDYENAGVVAFIKSIVYSVIPAEGPDMDFVSRFIFFLKAQKTFNLDAIEKFIEKEDINVVNMIKKQNAGQSGFMTCKQQHYYDHYDEEMSDDEAEDERTGLLQEELDEATGLLQEDADEEAATGLLVEEGTALLEEQAVIHYPSLTRIATDETITINKPVFRLGKEQSYVDYFVSNNNAVSRNHADIITRGSKFFVLDLASKNHTYVNNQMIAVQCETELRDGDLLKLGNEEFIFHV